MRSLRTLVLTAGVIAIAAAVTATALAAAHRPDRHRARICGLDVVYVKTAIQGDVFEIKGGNLALGKTANASIKTLAQRLITDHTKSLHEALDIAREYGIHAQQEPTPSEAWELEELAELSGGPFDHDYAELEVADHQQDIEDARNEVLMGCNREIRADAAKELPTLREHLKLAQAALATTTED
jgi:putative membrane protein